MSAGTGYTPPGAPACPYAPRMTRAQAIALRAASGLVENCVVVITDAPVIGTAGNTSPTEIELQPQSPTDLGMAALVHTTFDGAAWTGRYDIDLGAGTITELTDGFGNTVKDVDANAPTVQTQFPWHLGSANLRDNYIEDSTLTGWDTQVGAIRNNTILESSIDLTGKTAGTIDRSTFTGGTVAVSGVFSAIRTQFLNPTISKAGTGVFSFTDSAIDHAIVNQAAGGAAPLICNDSELDDGTNIVLAATSLASGTVQIFEGCSGRFIVLQNGGAPANLALVQGAWTVILAAAALRPLQMTRLGGTGGTINQNGTVAGGTGDNFIGNQIGGDAIVNLNCTDNVARTYTKLQLDSGALVNIADPGGAPACLTAVVVQGVSTLNLEPGGSLFRARLSNGAIVNTGAFAHDDLIVDGIVTKTLTAPNVSRLYNKSFDDVI